MTGEWRARRFWTAAEVAPEGDGWTVRLDGRAVRTPLKTLLSMPSRALAAGVAAEWDAQGREIDPLSMPLTRAVNATLDKVVPQRDEVVAALAAYGASDLLCYRATGPAALVARQAAAWHPMLDWAASTLGARLAVTQGVIPVPQPANALEALRARVAAASPWTLTALSEFVSLSGSLVLGLAVLEGHDPGEVWDLSRVDESWQVEQWGVDDEEAARIAVKRAAFLQAHRYFGLLRAG